MKIAMIGHKRIPSREGGVEVVVSELSTRMVKRGHSVTVYNRTGTHVAGKEYKTAKLNTYEGVRIKRVPTINKKGLAAVSSAFFAAIRAAFGDYDVVHFHAEGPCSMAWIPKLFGKRIVATIHGLDWQRAKWGRAASFFLKLGEKVAAGCADELIVLSHNTVEYFKDTYNRDAVFISNGTEPHELVPTNEITKEWQLTKDSYILYLGRIVPEKCVLNLVNEFRNVKTDKRLVIAGGSSDTPAYLKQVKAAAANDDRILFTGFVVGDRLAELYSNAYCYCLPSDLEGMPMSLLEAMSFGVCCVVSDISECTEVVEDKAVVFDRKQPGALANALQMLCDNSALVEKYRAQAREYICNKYSWEKTVDATLKLYEKDR